MAIGDVDGLREYVSERKIAEIIIAASGLSHDAFADKVHCLCRDIKESSPRPCSFALATLETCTVSWQQARNAYRAFDHSFRRALASIPAL